MIQSGVSFTNTITLVTEICCNCGVAFALPSDLQEVLMNSPNKMFYCPNGHGQHYAKSQEVLRREEAEKRLREKELQLINSANQKIQLEQQLKTQNRKLKRLTNGVCPCCNRSFHNLQQHMKKQHPEAVNKTQ